MRDPYVLQNTLGRMRAASLAILLANFVRKSLISFSGFDFLFFSIVPIWILSVWKEMAQQCSPVPEGSGFWPSPGEW